MKTLWPVKRSNASRKTSRTSATGLFASLSRNQIEQHYGIRSTHFQMDLARRYLLNLYDAHFAGKVEQSRQHYNQADRQYVLARLADMRPSVIKGLEYLAEQIARRNDVQVLRLPQRPRHMRMIDLDTDLDRALSELV
jgi:hypothetical protein